MTSSPNDVTRILCDLADGRPHAADRLWPLVYDELRRLAEHYLRGEPEGHTLQPTALVHEAYIRLVGQEPRDLPGRAGFFGLAARAMRRILIDHARRRRARKRGGARRALSLDDGIHAAAGQDDYLVQLDEALERLAALDPQLVRVVELRFFAGMDFAETARALNVAPITAKRYWRMAKGWLHREMTRGPA